MIGHALKKDLEDRLWEKWLAELPKMDQKTFVSFDDYKMKHYEQEQQKKSEEEILQDAENILKSMGRQ